MSAKSLFGAFSRAFSAFGNHNCGIVAAGITYYAFLAIVPLLASAVLTYGLVASPETVSGHISALAQMLPGSASELIGEQLEAVTRSNSGATGLGLVIALAIALVGARNGAGSIVIGLNIAYDTPNDRGFIAGNALALAITAGALVAAGFAVGAIAVLAALDEILPWLGGTGVAFGTIVTYAVLLAAGIGGALVLFRVAPDERHAGWRRDLPGAVFTGTGWVLLTFLFGLYVANFGSYNATYGSLGAVIVLLTWLYLNAYLLLFGAELNANWREPAPLESGTYEQVARK